MDTRKLLQSCLAMSLASLALVVAGQIPVANAAPSNDPVGYISVATSGEPTQFVVGLQESIVALGASGGRARRTQTATSVRVVADTKATGPTACKGTDVTAFSISTCTTGLTDPAVLEGAGAVVSTDSGTNGTGSVGGVAVIPAGASPTGATLIASAPQLRPSAKAGSSGPNAILTTDIKGLRVSTQYVPGVVPGPACATAWGDASAATYLGSNCDTPLAQIGETTGSLPATAAQNDALVGIGDVELSADGSKLLATNVHDGYVYTGPVGVDGTLAKVPSRPAFATDNTWRPYGLSNYAMSTLVTWTKLAPPTPGAENLIESMAVAALDQATNTWRNVVEPVPVSLLGDAHQFGVLSAAEVDINGDLVVTFLNVHRQAISTTFQEAISAPVIKLSADGVDHWTNNVAAAQRLASYAIDGTPNPSFGRLHRDPRRAQTIVTSIDPLKYYSGGLTWYDATGGLGGREQVTWRGEGTGAYRSGTRTVDYDRYLNDEDLLVKRRGNEQDSPWVDVFGFGKSNGLGDLETLSNVALVGGRTWADSDADGIQEPGEASIADVAIEVVHPGGTAVVRTDARGVWVASIDTDRPVQARVAASNFEAGAVFGVGGARAGWFVTAANSGTDRGVDSDAESSTRVLLGVGRRFLAGAVDYTFDAGFMPAASTRAANVIRGIVYNDLDGNGIRGSFEPPAPGISVKVLASGCTTAISDAAGVMQTPQPSGASGEYAFAGLSPGNYCVVGELPPGYKWSGNSSVNQATGTVPVSGLGTAVAAEGAYDLGVASFGAPCLKLNFEIQDGPASWREANDATSAPANTADAASRNYRATVINCGSTALGNAVLMPGVVGAAPLSWAMLAPGQVIITEPFIGRAVQSIATASLTAVDVRSGRLVNVTDPAHLGVVPATVSVLPRTGGGIDMRRAAGIAEVLVIVGAMLVALGYRRKLANQ